MPNLSDPYIIAWLIPLFPLIGFLINGALGGTATKKLAGIIATAAVFASFFVAVTLFLKVQASPEDAKQHLAYLMPWFSIPGIGGIPPFQVNFELLVDPLSVLMMLIITGVGGLIHLYSISYMAADKGFARFFTYLNLFVFFMLLLVMGNNLLILFIGWEGVGLCSYLLIGFFYEKKSAGDAAKKAFIVNRIGDVGVLIGMFLLFQHFGTLDFYHATSGTSASLVGAGTGFVQLALSHPEMIGGAATLACLMLFLGATGKSAQLPLYNWLPDAMEGPTPVSALIHAATMVTAGVYMVSRTHTLFELSDVAMGVIAFTGIATALFAATIGLMQNDIKRVLAYSTVSQLGYMFAACGAGVFAAGMYHVMTHAFFKACLFLGSGSVIHAIEHAMHAQHGHGHGDAHEEHGDAPHGQVLANAGPDPNDPQDMRNMGGLLGRTKITAGTMIIATLAIAGIVPFAGFWSKDEILWRMFNVHSDLHGLFYGVGAVTALLTAFYMFRLISKTFLVAPQTEAAKHAHESSPLMTIPLVILAALSTLTGWAVLKYEDFSEYLAPSVTTKDYAPTLLQPSLEHPLGYGLMIVILVIIGICISIYRSKPNGELMSPQARADRHLFSPGWYNWVLLNKYFVDEAYNFWFVHLGKKFSYWLWKTFDVDVVDGIVNGVGALTGWTGSKLRLAQSGYVRNYAFSMVIGIILVLFIVFQRSGHGW
ncbi:NADH-quinone oxidoreductase subunit L [Capsulimonas corticalis]|uniref:NADH-quinone oxidoreductase subunit L n=1 Tax=Capsulimonas corticalis TaxID=2219043 RepID=A0A402CYD7_9BACT|nr:NADH-quinone oxidoreductase subunit L [Capsulimonas corticalis]BDI31366.1 NADH-quinone oxidoreductase subunit L [Capsulimonas corticalis]